jgi:hypothetical protein
LPLALLAEDVEFVVEMLRLPKRGYAIRSRWLRETARRLRERSAQLIAESNRIRTLAQEERERARR